MKNGTGVAILRTPVPSRVTESSIWVSLVLRSTVARRLVVVVVDMGRGAILAAQTLLAKGFSGSRTICLYNGRNGAMTKPLRSPVVGYNHNLRYRGRLFHVQTEDSGPVNPHVFTHLFYEGTILASKKLQYNAESHEDVVKTQMQHLHKSMMRELSHGDHDQRVIAFFAARGQEAFSEPPPVRAAPAPAAAVAVAPAAVATAVLGVPSAELGVPTEPLVAASPAAAQVIPVTGVVAGSIDNGPTRRPAPAVATPGAKVSSRPVVMVRPTAMKRPPMVFSSSADGGVVQRSVVVTVGAPVAPSAAEPAPRIRPAAVIGEPSPVAPPPHGVQSLADQAPVARSRAPLPGGDTAFSDLVSDKSLDEVILEYLSDDNEPDRR